MKKILGVLLCLTGLSAQADDVFIMNNVLASAQAENAVLARETAMDNAQQQAFVALLDKIVAPQDRSAVNIESVNPATLVQDLSVTNEKSGIASYSGTLTVRFKAAPIRALLKEQQVSFLSRLPEPMLVVPVFYNEGILTELNEENLLYQALKNTSLSNHLFTLVLPENTAEELALVQTALQGASPYLNLQPLLVQKNVNAVMVLTINKTGVSYRIKTQVLPETSAPEAEIDLVVSDDREDLKRVLSDLSNDTVKALSKKWLYMAQESTQPVTVYHVFAPVEKVSDLARMQEKIRQIKFADSVEIKGYANKRLAVDLHFRGTLDELAQKLDFSGLLLEVDTLAETSEEPVYLMREKPVQSEMSSITENVTTVSVVESESVSGSTEEALQGMPVAVAEDTVVPPHPVIVPVQPQVTPSQKKDWFGKISAGFGSLFAPITKKKEPIKSSQGQDITGGAFQQPLPAGNVPDLFPTEPSGVINSPTDLTDVTPSDGVVDLTGNMQTNESAGMQNGETVPTLIPAADTAVAAELPEGGF